MGIEEMRLSRAQYRKRRRTMDEVSALLMTGTLVWYFVKQGAMRGFLYGAAYGVFFFIVGALYGCVFGLIAGVAAGLLNGAALSAINAIQRNSEYEESYFLRTAAYAGPPLTAAVCYVVFRMLVAPGWGEPDQPWWTPNYLYDVIPSLIAGFAAWQAARKMEDWYFE